MRQRKGGWTIRVLLIAVMAFVLVPATGCDDQQAIDEFRTASAAGLSTGIQSMFGALVEGMIAVYEPDGESSSAAASSGN